MRFERLVIEAEENTFSLEFHPRMTVIGGVGRLEREGLISELVGSLSSSRAGVHAEIVADNGNRFAVFRPIGARARVVDVDAAADVSHRFADADGVIDLLTVGGRDTRDAKRFMRFTATDLTTSTHHDQIVHRLAAVDPTELWAIADEVDRTQRILDEAADASGSVAEDAAVVARIEERHREFEDAQAQAEKVRRISFVVGVAAAVTVVPLAMWIGRTAAMAMLIVAAVVTAMSFVQNQRMTKARDAEAEALAAAGATSYLGFHLQRVNGLVDDQKSRQILMNAATDRDKAAARWFEVAGDILVSWARENRGEIEAAARRRIDLDARRSTPLPSAATAGDDFSVAAHALAERLEVARRAGPAGEMLPLVIDDALIGLDPAHKAPLLEVLVQASEQQQIVYLTEDPAVAGWARVEAMTGDLTILEPSAGQAPAATTHPTATVA